MRALLFLLLPCVFASPVSEGRAIPAGSCGVNKYGTYRLLPAEPYIVGGKTAIQNYYPWQASLQVYNSHMCGGTIISDQYILTAAHCFEQASYEYQWTVVLGKHSLATTESVQKTFGVAKITMHTGYNATSSNRNDITLMKLSSKITFTDDIQPICLPPASLDAVNLTNFLGTVSGWGAMYEGGGAATYLQEVQVPVITNTKCQQKYPQEKIAEGVICAGYDAGGKDSCQGDSGGPFIMKVDDGTGAKWTQVGVVSWGYGCAHANLPGVYTRVTKYLSWIKANMI